MALEREKLTADKEAEKQRRDDERQSKENKEHHLRVAQADTAIFRGALSTKSKSQLKDLPYAPDISMDGTAKDLTTRITEFFGKNEALRHDPRYVGLFNRSRAPPSTQPPPGTPFGDVNNLDPKAVAGPSHSYPNFNLNLEAPPIPYTQCPAVNYPYALNNPDSLTLSRLSELLKVSTLNMSIVHTYESRNQQ
ncbi:hypothetical protein FB451DRAFT_1388226 [Mycena latifolia]|nr:hypothetical protein FB451DRAFT_1388226 [Mycena latifolia]